MGAIKVEGIANSGAGNDLYIYTNDADININATDNTASINAQNINLNSNDNVTINTLGGDRTWNFTDGGVLYGPAEDGQLEIAGIRGENGHPTMFIGPDSIVLDGNNGEFLNDPNNPTNQIATIGHVASNRFGASASYYSTVDQGPQTSVDTVQAFTFNNTDWATGITLANTSRITMTNAGKYNIAFSAQLYQTSNTGTVNIWLSKNGTPMTNTNTKLVVESNAAYKVAAWNFFVDSAAGDYYELIWSSSSTNTKIEYDAQQTINGNVHPAIPSIILTVNQVG
jgi:hypothetical protein